MPILSQIIMQNRSFTFSSLNSLATEHISSVQYDKDFKFTMKDPALWLLSRLSKAKWWTAEEVKGFNGDAAKLKGIRIKLFKKWRRKAPKPNQKQ